jgi:uncharacterized protein YndB with AHSA1/START domain
VLSKNEIIIEAPRERVFAVLGDAGTYADWVVGAVEVRDADESWPDEGSELHHTQGIGGPLVIKDETRVLESEPPSRLVLLAEIEPLGKMHVTIDLFEEPEGRTRVRMLESPAAGFVAATRNPLSDWLLGGRNVVSLKRLKQLTEQV